eukprot:scaffold3276_cov168-Amphora_coffeaeformis.AAC.5
MKNELALICGLYLVASPVNGELDPERRDAWKPVNKWPMYNKYSHNMAPSTGMYTNPQKKMYTAQKPMTWMAPAKTWMAPTKTWMAPAKTWKPQMKWQQMPWMKSPTVWKGKGDTSSGKGSNGKESTGFKKKKKRAKGKGSTGKSNNLGKSSSGKGKSSVSYKGKGMIMDECNECRPDCIGVQEFLLIDSFNDEPLLSIMPNDLLNLGALYQMFPETTEYAIECVTFGDVVSTLVSEERLGLNNTDNDMPWTLSGDENGNYFRTPLQENPGPWTVTCQPFCGVNATGETSGPSTINFEFFIPSPTNAPTSRPTRAPTTASPTRAPTTSAPTDSPTSSPTTATRAPTSTPTDRPTDAPTLSPTTASPTETPLDCSICQRGCVFVDGFALVDASINGFFNYEESKLLEIEDGAVLDLSDLRDQYGQDKQFTIVCRTDPYSLGAPPGQAFEIGSAGLRDNFASARLSQGASASEQVLGVTDPFSPGYYNDEGEPPFTLSSDNAGAYNPTLFDAFLGEWTVSCQVFCDKNLGWGEDIESGGAAAPGSEAFSSEEVSISFTVVA